MTAKFQEIPVDRLFESPHNPRKHFDAAGLEDLAGSIREKGILVPLLARPVDERFEIAAGHRRFRAAAIAGLDHLPVIVRKMDDLELLEVLVIENNQREDVHPLEEAQGYKALIDAGYSVDRTASRVGRSREYVYQRLSLLQLTPEAQKLFFDGAFSFSHARLLSHLSAQDQARALKVPDWDEGGVFRREQRELDQAEAPVMTTSVLAFRHWIDENVRLDPERGDLSELFPDTAAVIADAGQKAEQVALITREYEVQHMPKADAERILTRRSWKRADGSSVDEEIDRSTNKRPKSKKCDVSVIGVVVLGRGRAETFRVCVDKLCNVHWGKDQKEKAKRWEESAGDREQNRKWKQEQAKEAARSRAFEKARPEILKAFAAAAESAPIKKLGDLVLEDLNQGLFGASAAFFRKNAPAGATAEAYVKRAALAIAIRHVDQGDPTKQIEKALGVDLTEILKPHMPAPEKPKTKKATKKKGSK